MILDKYFARPVFWDYTLGLAICIFIWFLKSKQVLVIPENSVIISTTTDLSTISLTIAGFILTLLTVLITFKGSNQSQKKGSEDETVFDAFFGTGLYYLTVKHLSNGIKSLTFVSFIGYGCKLTLQSNSIPYVYYFNVFGLLVVILTIWRSLLILSKIVALQKEG